MGSNLKKIRSLRLKTKLIYIGAIISLGYTGIFLLNNFLKENYSSRKVNFEKRLEKSLNIKVDLGDYSGIRFLGISIADTSFIDKGNTNSEIKAKNVYLGIMPIKSFFNQKWIFKIKPAQTQISIDKNFFKREKIPLNKRNKNKSKINFALNFNLSNSASLKLKDFGVNTKIKGDFIYKSSSRQIFGNIKSKSHGKGFLNLKLNRNLNRDLFSLKLISRNLDLDDFKYIFKNRKFEFTDGKLNSNFKFFKSSTKTFCEGKVSLDNLILKTSNLKENINSESLKFLCKDNSLNVDSDNFNYGTLTSDFKLNIPLNNSINNIDLYGTIGYLDSLNPDIKFSGNIPYWVDKRGINFGTINSIFDLNRTQLSNLNIFRSNKIRGFVTANGILKGKLSEPNISINFNVDYPTFKGIRIRERWEGEIKNKKNKFLLNMKNRYSPIPSFLSIKFDSSFKLDNLIFSRVFNSNKGSLQISKDNDNDNYLWVANNFPLDELERSRNNNQFDKISGIINGSGLISSDQSFFNGRLAWSLGKYRNIKFANSLFDFTFKDKSFYVNSSLYPIDGGMIDAEYNSNQNNLINVKFNNISTNWSILTAVNIFNFDNRIEEIPEGKAGNLDDLQINKNDMLFKDKIKFIDDFLKNNIVFEDKFNLKKYLNNFDSRYNGSLTIVEDSSKNYKLNTKLNGYLENTNNDTKNNKDKFSIALEGGLFKGKGFLEINNLPLSTANIFLDEPKDFRGGFDIKLFYDLDKKSFSSDIYSNKTFIKNNQIIFDKGMFKYENSIFEIDLSLLLNESIQPIKIEGSIPLNKDDKLDLRLNGNGKFVELIDIFSDEYFTFKEGDVNLKMIIKGKINQPILNGFIVIEDSEVEVYNNTIENINSVIIFDFDYLEIKNLTASVENSGNIFIKGSLPFYDKNNLFKKDIILKSSKFKVQNNNINFLVDSNLNISGSFKKPILGGNLALNNGFINFNTSKNKNNNRNNLNFKKNKKNWPELYWNNDQNIEIISNETILNSVFLGENLPKFLENLSFNNLKLKLGPDFRLQYSEIVKADLDTKLDLNINGEVGNDLNARGLIFLKKGRANLYTTPFKLDKNKNNYILFASRSGVVPFINFSLVSKVPDSIIPIRENNQDINILGDYRAETSSSGFGTFGIGNSRLIKIEASYEGFLDQLSFEDENKRIQLRSTPSYNRSQIIGLIGGNSANLINRAFISQFNSAEAFSERFQLSLYPALIENNESLNNVFSNENLDIESDDELTSNEVLSSQAWVAEIGLDITDSINFAVQTTPGRDDLPPLGILTFQANPNLELLGSFDSNGDWKSEVQLFFRY